MRRRPAHTQVSKAMFGHHVGVVEIAAVDDDRVAKRLVNPAKVEFGKLGPIGEDEHSVGIGNSIVGVSCVAKPVARRQYLLGALHRRGIEGGNGAAFVEQHLYDLDRRGLTDVVGISFEGEAKHTKTLAPQVPQRRANLADEALLLLDIDLLHFAQKVEVDSQLFGDGAEGGYILGEAGS